MTMTMTKIARRTRRTRLNLTMIIRMMPLTRLMAKLRKFTLWKRLLTEIAVRNSP